MAQDSMELGEARRALEVANAVLESEKRILGLIVAEAPLAAILDTLAREVESRSVHGMLCSVLMLDEEGVRLVHGAAPSLPEAYNHAIVGQPIGPRAGSCGTSPSPASACAWATSRTIPYGRNTATSRAATSLRRARRCR